MPIYNDTGKFCTTCGHATELANARGFDQTTGRPNQRRVCAKPGCPEYCRGHGGHDYRKTGGWFSDVRCTRCGEYEPVYD